MDERVLANLADFVQFLLPNDKAGTLYLDNRIKDNPSEAFNLFRKVIFIDPKEFMGDPEVAYLDEIMSRWAELSYEKITEIEKNALCKLIADRLELAAKSADIKRKKHAIGYAKQPGFGKTPEYYLMSWRGARQSMRRYLSLMVEDKGKLKELIEEIANSEKGYAHTKATLWLHECGFGFDFTPASSQVDKFLKEYDPEYPMIYKYCKDRDFYVINDRLQKLTEAINTRFDLRYKVSDVDACICVYEKMKGMAGKRKPTLPEIQKYMEKRSGERFYGIGKFYEEYADVERIDDLKADLNGFLSLQ